MRTEPDRVDLFLAFVVDPGIDHVLGEDVSLGEELIVLLEGIQGLLETKIAAMEAADAEKETKGIPGDKPQE